MSELKKSLFERSLMEANLDPLVTIKKSGEITDLNQAMVQFTGSTRALMIGSYFFDYFQKTDKGKKIIEKIFKDGEIIQFPVIFKDITGKQTEISINGISLEDIEGIATGILVISRNIQNQNTVERELTEAKVFAELATAIAEAAQSKAEKSTKIAEDAVKAKQQFLSNMSHEIRTPMNAIIGFAKVLLKTQISDKQSEYLQAIKTSGDALIVLINDILDLAKVDAGKMIFEYIPFRMNESISAMLHIFETKVLEKNVLLTNDYDSHIPEVLIGDPVRLHQIILNLLSNAVKFTNKGEITLKLRVVKEDSETSSIEFTVSDTGIGIPSSKFEDIFENFNQATSETSRLYGGTGLGLAIVKQLVGSQGGSVAVESEVGVGSSFSFVLNFQKTNIKLENEISKELLTQNLNHIKVLVVEDIPLNQLLMKTLLDEFGFDRDIASDGKIAIEMLQEKSYDLILMDLQMPVMDGFETTHYIRNTLLSKIPIIALTADVTTADLAKCRAVGMNDYLAKPVDERLLLSKIIHYVKKTKDSHLNDSKIEEKAIQLQYTNLGYLLERTKANPVLMREMISLYLEQTPPLVASMKSSLVVKDWNKLQATVHKIIPSFAIMGISSEFEMMAKNVQTFAQNQQQTEKIHEMVLEIEKICIQSCKELEIAYHEIKPSVK